MDLEKTWQSIESKDNLLDPILNSKFDTLRSISPLKKIKKNMLHGIYWGIMFSTLYIIIIIYYHIWLLTLMLGVLIIFNSWLIITSYKLYNTINENIESSNSILDELKKNHWSIIQWWSIQQKVSLLVYPFAVVGGFIIGGFVGSGKTLEMLFAKNIFILSMIISTALLVPLSYWIARQLFKHSFGKYLSRIEDLIELFNEET